MPTVSRNLRYGELTHVLEGAVTVVPGTEPATVRVVSVASGWSKEVGSFCDDDEDIRLAGNTLLAKARAKERGEKRRIDKRRECGQ